MRSGWLLRDDDVLCALEMTDTRADRRAGLRQRTGGARAGSGALHLGQTRVVHSLGLGAMLDVAFLSEDLTVLRLTQLGPWRVAMGGGAACSAVAAEAGSLERWGVKVGDQLMIREVQ